jgi:thioredoxin reductase (NADPH)
MRLAYVARQDRTLPILDQIPETLPRRKTSSRPQNWADVLVIGAGPTGLACAIEAQRVGLRVLVLDKGCLVNSLFHYPANMTFFTTPELLEIGEIPFASANMKPTRQEALEYYRKVTERFDLKVLQYHWVKTVTGEDNHFRVTATDRTGGIHDFEARKIVVATGYYDLPNMMSIPGEDLVKVSHYYHEPHPYYDSDVLVIGGKNSAAIAALELWRHGARVTLVYSVSLQTPHGPVCVENDFVFALTGYHPDYDFLQSLGIELSKEQCRPVCDPETLESNVPGIYVAGVIVAGAMTSEIFIENGRFHGKLIAADLRQKLSKA